MDNRKLKMCMAELQSLPKRDTWYMHPGSWRKLRMRDLPYFQYRKRRQHAIIPTTRK